MCFALTILTCPRVRQRQRQRQSSSERERERESQSSRERERVQERERESSRERERVSNRAFLARADVGAVRQMHTRPPGLADRSPCAHGKQTHTNERRPAGVLLRSSRDRGSASDEGGRERTGDRERGRRGGRERERERQRQRVSPRKRHRQRRTDSVGSAECRADLAVVREPQHRLASLHLCLSVSLSQSLSDAGYPLETRFQHPSRGSRTATLRLGREPPPFPADQTKRVTSQGEIKLGVGHRRPTSTCPSPTRAGDSFRRGSDLCTVDTHTLTLTQSR